MTSVLKKSTCTGRKKHGICKNMRKCENVSKKHVVMRYHTTCCKFSQNAKKYANKHAKTSLYTPPFLHLYIAFSTCLLLGVKVSRTMKNCLVLMDGYPSGSMVMPLLTGSVSLSWRMLYDMSPEALIRTSIAYEESADVSGSPMVAMKYTASVACSLSAL